MNFLANNIKPHKQNQEANFSYQDKETFLNKKMELLTSCHSKLLAVVKAKGSSFLEQQNEEGKESLPKMCIVPS